MGAGGGDMSSDPVSPNRDLSPQGPRESKAGGRGSHQKPASAWTGPPGRAAQDLLRSQETRLPASPGPPGLLDFLRLPIPFPLPRIQSGLPHGLERFYFNAPPKKMLNEIKQSPAVFWSLYMFQIYSLLKAAVTPESPSFSPQGKSSLGCFCFSATPCVVLGS